jgi:DNA recombination protein RmuC
MPADLIWLTVGLLAGAALSWAWMQHRLSRAEAERARLQATLDAQADLREQHERLKQSFQNLAQSALDQSNERFLRMAEERFGHLQKQSKSELEKKEQSIEALLKPINEALDKTEKQLQSMEKERERAYGDISRYLKGMNDAQEQLRSETRNLVNALRRPEVRGQWGELTLKRLVELAGMLEHCDFYEQEHRDSDEGRLRPDMVVRLPDQRELVVDVKTPLDAYLSAMEASDDVQRDTFLNQHASKVRKRVKELASKAYWSQFRNSPEFVILFIPGDQFLSAALDKDPSLIDEAIKQKVIIATPSSFIALLKAVAFGWRQQAMAENADAIRDTAVDLYHRLATFTEHLSRLGRSVGQTVDNYNRAVGSLERNVLPGARRFTEMGVQARKKVENPDSVDHAPRRMEGPDAPAAEEKPGGKDSKGAS